MGEGKETFDSFARRPGVLECTSVGRNPHGHPTEKALKIFEGAGAEVLRTDRLDDIVLEIDGTGRVRLD